VVWSFQPRSVKIGFYVTLVTLLAVGGYAFYARRRSGAA
jgi:hypothetical protein